jgi:hypothetical protein
MSKAKEAGNIGALIIFSAITTLLFTIAIAILVDHGSEMDFIYEIRCPAPAIQ